MRIENSKPAPLFKLRAQPNDWHAQVAADAGTTSKQAGKAPLYQSFWARFLERLRQEHPDWTNAGRKPQSVNWFDMSSPFKGGTRYAACFARGGKLRSELYIDTGDQDANATLFDKLVALRGEIEAAYGGQLAWEDLPTKRGYRIAAYGDGDVSNGDQFDAYIDWFVATGMRLRAAFDTAAASLK